MSLSPEWIPAMSMLKAEDAMGYAQDILDVALQKWLSKEEARAQERARNAEFMERSANRRSRLLEIASFGEQLHEIDAQIDLLMTLPESEKDVAMPMVERLRAVRKKLRRRGSKR